MFSKDSAPADLFAVEGIRDSLRVFVQVSLAFGSVVIPVLAQKAEL